MVVVLHVADTTFPVIGVPLSPRAGRRRPSSSIRHRKQSLPRKLRPEHRAAGRAERAIFRENEGPDDASFFFIEDNFLGMTL